LVSLVWNDLISVGLVSSLRHRDFIHPGRQIGVVTQAESVKKLAPFLVQSLRDAIQKPKNSHLRDCKDFFFNAAQKSVENLMKLFESSEELNDQGEMDGTNHMNVTKMVPLYFFKI